MEEPGPGPPLLPPLLLLERAMEPPTTRAETRMFASQVHSVLENDSVDSGKTHPARPPTAMSGTPRFVSQDVRVPVANLSNNAGSNPSAVKIPRGPTPSAEHSRGVVP